MADDFASIAYGFLWLGETDDKRLHEARRLLLAVIGPEGQKRGIASARLMMGINAPQDHGLQLRDPPVEAVRHAIEQPEADCGSLSEPTGDIKSAGATRKW